MKILICGSRSLGSNAEAEVYIKAVLLKANPYRDIIITGGAKGIDTLAAQQAEALDFKVEVHKPNYNDSLKGFKSAPILRNIIMIKKADKIYAISDGKSKGTNFVIKFAKQIEKEIIVKYITGS